MNAFARAIHLDPDDRLYYSAQGQAFYALGDLQAARTLCENRGNDPVIEFCLALTHNKLGRRPDAEAALMKLSTSRDDAAAGSYAQLKAQMG